MTQNVVVTTPGLYVALQQKYNKNKKGGVAR